MICFIGKINKISKHEILSESLYNSEIWLALVSATTKWIVSIWNGWSTFYLIWKLRYFVRLYKTTACCLVPL